MAATEQRETAARLLAEGSSLAAAARAIGISDRSLRRWRQMPDFAALVTRYERQAEQAAHDAAAKRAKRAGTPAPTPPAARRTMQDALNPEALEAMRQRDPRFRPQATDAEILAWVLDAPRTNESDWLDARDAEAGVISSRARARFEGRLVAPRLRPFTTPSIAEQQGFFAGAFGVGPDTRDPFLQLDPHCYGGSDAR